MLERTPQEKITTPPTKTSMVLATKPTSWVFYNMAAAEPTASLIFRGCDLEKAVAYGTPGAGKSAFPRNEPALQASPDGSLVAQCTETY